MIHENQPNEYDTLTYEGEEYKIKWYQGYLFATEELADVLLDNNGDYVSDKAQEIDERIAYYFDTADFDGKSGSELFKAYELN